jgi:hypothetical protein
MERNENSINKKKNNMKNILAENMIRFGTKNLSEQTKLILTEDISEFKNVTNAIQPLLDTFNKECPWTLTVTPTIDSWNDTQGNAQTMFYWEIDFNNTAVGKTPVNFCKLSVIRNGIEKDMGNAVINKRFEINSKGIDGKYDQTVCRYMANSNEAPKWNDTITSKAIENMTISFRTSAGDSKRGVDQDQLRKSADAVANNGATLILGLKEVFNSVKISPTIEPFKSKWKGMKTV